MSMRFSLLVLAMALIVMFNSPLKGFNIMSQDQKLPEPEIIGAFYFLDSANNSLVALEKQIATVKKRGMFKGEIVAEVKGEKAPVRFKSDQKLEFVVNLPNGVDPNKSQLIIWTVKKGKREVVMVEATWTGSKANPVFLPYTVTKFGNAYKFTPSQSLPAGEYAFSPTDTYDAYCFGIDSPNDNTNKK